MTGIVVPEWCFLCGHIIGGQKRVFLFPWALVFLETATFVFYAMIIFIAILLFGVAYAWRKGVLQWR